MEELLVLAIIIIFLYLFYYNNERVKHKNISNFCDKYGICTKVDAKFKNEFEDIKKILLQFYNDLILAMEKKYPNDPRTKRLKRGFKINNVYQVFPNNNDGDTSYTINKGEEMGLCIRSGEDINKLEIFCNKKYIINRQQGYLVNFKNFVVSSNLSHFINLIYFSILTAALGFHESNEICKLMTSDKLLLRSLSGQKFISFTNISTINNSTLKCPI